MIKRTLTSVYTRLNDYHDRLYSPWRILCIFIPIFASSILNHTVTLADTMMVSVVSQEAVSGVNLTNQITTVFSTFILAFGVAACILETQYVGRKDYESASKIVRQSILVCLITCLPFSLAFLFFSPQIISLFGEMDPAIFDAAVTSGRLNAFYYLVIAMNTCVAQVFICQGNTKVSSLVNVFVNILNVIGNYLLINVFGLAVMGAKLATVLSSAVGTVIFLFLATRKTNPVRLAVDSLRSLIPSKETVKRLISLGIPTGFENNLSNFAKLFVTALVYQCSLTAINADAVTHTLTSLYVTGGVAVGSVMSIVVGHCRGAGRVDEVKYYTKFFIFASMIFQFIFGGLIILFMNPILAGFGNMDAPTAALVRQLTIPYLIVGVPFWTLAYTPPNAMRACGEVKFPMILSVSSLWICRVGFAYLIFFVFDLGIWSIWAASYIDWLVRSAANLLYLKLGRWAEKKVI